MSSKVRNDLVVSFGSQAFYKLVGYLVLAMLARHLTQGDLGRFMYASTLAGVAVLFTELGTSDHLVRAVARERERAGEWLGQVLSLRGPLLGGYLALLTVGTWVLEPDLVPVVVPAALYVGMKNLYRACSRVLYGLRHVGTTVVLYGGGMTLLLVLIFWIVQAGGGLGSVLLAYCVWTGSLLAAGLLTVRTRVGPIRLGMDLSAIRPVLRASVPLFLMTAASLIHFKVDTLMLGFLRPYETVALYEAGAKLLEASQFLVRPLTVIFFPICSEMVSKAEWGPLGDLIGKMAPAAAGLGVALAAGVILLAPWIIPFVFGAGFDGSVPVLRILYLSVPFFFLSSVSSFLAMALEFERKAIGILVLGIVVNVFLNAILIPRFGEIGASWTTICSEAVIAIWLLVMALRTVRERRKEKAPAHV